MIDFQTACRLRPQVSYCAALDAGSQEKLSLIKPWIVPGPPGIILDVGSGPGKLTANLAQLYPRCNVLGLDYSKSMVALAQQKHGDFHANLNFQWGTANSLEMNMANTIILSSVLHEVYSYSNDSLQAVADLLRSAWGSLRPSGRIIIRDFIRPESSEAAVFLRHRLNDICLGHDFESFHKTFGRKIMLRSVQECNLWKMYETDIGSAYEYIYRKDFHEMWEIELLERYGFWSLESALALLKSTGFSVIHFELLQNSWLLNNSFMDRVELVDPCNGKQIRLPQSQILLVAEKSTH